MGAKEVILDLKRSFVRRYTEPSGNNILDLGGSSYISASPDNGGTQIQPPLYTHGALSNAGTPGFTSDSEYFAQDIFAAFTNGSSNHMWGLRNLVRSFMFTRTNTSGAVGAFCGISLGEAVAISAGEFTQTQNYAMLRLNCFPTATPVWEALFCNKFGSVNKRLYKAVLGSSIPGIKSWQHLRPFHLEIDYFPNEKIVFSIDGKIVFTFTDAIAKTMTPVGSSAPDPNANPLHMVFEKELISGTSVKGGTTFCTTDSTGSLLATFGIKECITIGGRD